MELEFPRRRIFNSTFVTPSSDCSGASKPVYRISTTHNWTFLPHLTSIEFVGTEDPEKHQVVAQVIWNWPFLNRSFVHFGGHLYPLFEFLGCGEGLLNMDAFITFENETYTWRTHAFEPQLYDSKGRQIVMYKRDRCGLRKPNNMSPLGHLRISGDIASNPAARDAVFTSFFLFKVTRDLHLPWKKPYDSNTALPDKQTGSDENAGAQTVSGSSESVSETMVTETHAEGKVDNIPLSVAA